MLLALAFHSRDSQMSLDLLSWLSELSGQIQTTLVLVHEQSVDATQHNLAASRVFQSVKHLPVTTFADKWPHAPNCYFAQTASAMSSQAEPWYWFEPDNLPLNPYWFSELKAAYQSAGKPCMGTFFPSWFPTPGGWKQDGVHLTGSAIYPANLYKVSSLCKFILNGVRDSLSDGQVPKAFDVFMQGELVPKSHETNLIQHTWRSENYRVGNGIEFDIATDPSLAQSLNIRTTVSPEALVVHGCKDGSLLRVARKLHAQGKLRETIVLARNKPQNAPEAQKANFTQTDLPSSMSVKFKPFLQPKPERAYVDPWGASAELAPDPRVPIPSKFGQPTQGDGILSPIPGIAPVISSDVTQARETFRSMAHNPGCLSRVPCLNYLNNSPFLICDCGARVQLSPSVDWKTMWKGGTTGAATFSEPTENGGEEKCRDPKIGTSTPIIDASNGARDVPSEPRAPAPANRAHIFNSDPERNQKMLSQAAIQRKGELLDLGAGKKGAFSVLREHARKAGVKGVLRLKKAPLVDAILEAELGEKMYEAI